MAHLLDATDLLWRTRLSAKVDVIPLVRRDRVDAIPTDTKVAPIIVEGVQTIIPVLTTQVVPVGGGNVPQVVVVRTADQTIPQDVITVLAKDQIIAPIAPELVQALSPVNLISAAESLDELVATQGIDEVGAVTSCDVVVSRRADDRTGRGP